MFEPIIAAGPAVTIHVIGATTAIIVGPIAFLRKRRDLIHKTLGYIWVTAMLATALSSFLIMDIRLFGPFSPIHLLSLFTLYGLWNAVGSARKRDIVNHRKAMFGLYTGALGIAGSFAFLPGRLMNHVIFEQAPTAGFLAVVMLAILGTLHLRRSMKRNFRPSHRWDPSL